MAENTMTKTNTAPFASCKKADKPYVFISYAHADQKKVYKIITQLYESGINIWYDEGIEPGKEYDAEIASAVANCDMFLIFLSNKSVARDYVFNEFTYARVNKKTILPCYLEDINPAPEHEDRLHGIKMHTKGKKIPVKKLPKLLAPCKIFGKRKATPITVNSQAPKVMKDFEYKIEDNGIVITNYTGSDSEVVVPESHNGILVTAIGEFAFAHCTQLTSITIPNSVTSIGKWAFLRCIRLTSVIIPDSVIYIGNDIFEHCNLLTMKCQKNSAAHRYATRHHIKFEMTEIEPKDEKPAGKDEIEKFAYLCYAKIDFEKLKDVFDKLKKEGYRIKPHECGEDSREADMDMLMCSEFIAFISQAAADNGKIFEFIKLAHNYHKRELHVLLEECSLPPEFNMLYGGKQQLQAKDNSEHDFGVKLRQYLTKHGCAPKAAGMVIPDFEYIINSDDTITLTKYTGKGGNVTIPSEYFDPPKRITAINNSAFNCTELTSVIIPNSVTKIGDSAFYCCTGLTSVIIPNKVTSIGAWAFWRCIGLTSVIIPDSVTKIGDYAFGGCTGLSLINVGKNNQNYTCRDGILFSKDLTELICYPAGKKENSYCIPNSVTSIGDSAFSYCTGLASITIPDSVTEIGNLAFNRCTRLTSIILPDSVTKIGDSAFGWCTGLTSVTIPDSVTEIGDSAFEGCTGLTSITIPDSVTEIGNLAFNRCTRLTSIILPDSVTEIGWAAFMGCTGLTSVTIPDSVTKIGDSAFEDCTGLTIYGSSGSYAEKYAFENKIPFKATDIAKQNTDSTPPAKKHHGKGWLITLIILALLIGAGFALQYFGIIDFQKLIELFGMI